MVLDPAHKARALSHGSGNYICENVACNGPGNVGNVLRVSLHKHVHVVASELVQSVAAHLQIGLLEPLRHGGRRLVLLRLCFAAAIVSGVLHVRDEVGTHLASELACRFLPQLAEAEAFLFFEVRVVSLF